MIIILFLGFNSSKLNKSIYFDEICTVHFFPGLRSQPFKNRLKNHSIRRGKPLHFIFIFSIGLEAPMSIDLTIQRRAPGNTHKDGRTCCA